jgi:tetratricopeptide (TPR) repeat protein
VLDHYRYNLMRMVDIARSVGAKVILITPASNLRHCSPFKSEHRTGLTGAQRNNWQMQFELASKAYAAAKWHEVLPAIDKAITIDRRYAHAHYLRGRALWELEHYDEAKIAFIRAMDEDVCALRAPTPILEIVKEVADKRNIPMVDFVALIEEQSEYAAPGEEQFLDHVHPTIEGNRRLALALLKAMGRQEIVHFANDWSDVLVEQITQEVESRLDVEAHGIALRNLSRLFRWAGKFEQGRTLGLRAVKMIPTDAESHLVAGANAAELGLIDEAIGHYRQAIQIKPDYAKAHGKLGDVMLKRGRFDEAINQYRQALETDPDYSHAHSNLGVATSAKGELDEAIGHFHQALRIDPDHVETHNSLGSVLVAQGRSDEAIKHFSHAIEVNPRHFHARSNLASVLRLQGRFDEAISHFQQVLQIKPDYVYAFNGLGLILQTRGKLDEAIDYYQQALEIEPDYAEAHGNLGDVLSGQGKLDEAISHYRRAVLADPNYAHAHCNLGVVISAKGELDQAEIHFRQALQIDPHYTEAHNNLASLLLAQGKLDEAINHYRQAVQTRPGYARARQGSDARRKSPVRLDNGASRYSQALRARPDYARVHHNLGRALTKAGEFVGALEHFRHAASLKPNWPTPLNDAARILATHSDPNVQDASRAVDFAERAAKLTEYRNVSVLDTLATAYAAAGQFDKAVDTIETAIVLASAANADNRVGHLRRRLGLYRQGKL